jgi:hypothetical protein
MSETLQKSLYQIEPGEETPTPEKAVNSTPQPTPHNSTPSANGVPHAEMSEAEAVNLLRSHRLPGSDILPFDSTASSPPATTLPVSRWIRWRRVIAAGLSWFLPHS